MIRALFGVVAAGTLFVALGAQAQDRKQKERAERQAERVAPPNMCRVWLDGVRPENQPAPTDCATALRNRPPNGRVIFGKQGDEKSLTKRQPPDTARPSNRKGKPDKPRKPE